MCNPTQECAGSHTAAVISMAFENMSTLLAPFEQLTREISSSTASVADVISSVMALKHLPNKTADTDRGVNLHKYSTRGCEQAIR